MASFQTEQQQQQSTHSFAVPAARLPLASLNNVPAASLQATNGHQSLTMNQQNMNCSSNQITTTGQLAASASASASASALACPASSLFASAACMHSTPNPVSFFPETPLRTKRPSPYSRRNSQILSANRLLLSSTPSPSSTHTNSKNLRSNASSSHSHMHSASSSRLNNSAWTSGVKSAPHSHLPQHHQHLSPFTDSDECNSAATQQNQTQQQQQAEPPEFRFDEEFDSFVPLGRGVQSQVFQVREIASGQLFAVKKSIHPLAGKVERQRYLKACQLMHALGHDDYIIKLYRAWQAEGHFFAQYELAQHSLTHFSRIILQQLQLPRLPFDRLLNWMLQISYALQHCHSISLLHLDVKPCNVLVCLSNPQSERLKLCDFGCARLYQELSDGSEGDRVYMAPELLTNSCSITSAADIFSLGLLMLELCTLAPLPQLGTVWQQLRSGHEPVQQYFLQHGINAADAHTWHPVLHPLMLACLSPHASERPTAADLVRVLRPHVSTESAPVPVLTPLPPLELCDLAQETTPESRRPRQPRFSLTPV